MRIGEQIRYLRKQQNMTLEELSEKSGVALATLSRMENNRMIGTLKSHTHIARALSVTLTELYSKVIMEEKRAEFTPHTATTDTFVHTEKSLFKILTSKALSKKMMPIMLTIQPAAQTHKEECRKGTEKFLYVLEGMLEAVIGKESFILHKKDALYFDASLPHFFKNTGKTIANTICVICPPAL